MIFGKQSFMAAALCCENHLIPVCARVCEDCQ